jgi:hypothetical protein
VQVECNAGPQEGKVAIYLRAAAATGSVAASAAAASVGLVSISAGFVVSVGLSSVLLLLRRPLSFDFSWESALGAIEITASQQR